MNATMLLDSLNVVGTFAFGLSGGMVAIRRRLDLFGILVLAVATGVAGGLVRDLMLGESPPGVLRNPWPIAVAGGAGLCAFFCSGLIDRLRRPVMILDAVGLAVFAVAGCHKALGLGLGAPGAVLLGVMSAVGGGMLRDMMAAEVPRVLHEEVYALAAMSGAVAYVALTALGLPESWGLGLAMLLAFALRLASVRFGWRLPGARRR